MRGGEEHVHIKREREALTVSLSLEFKSGAGLLSHEYPPQYHRR